MKICAACPECGSTEWVHFEGDGFVCDRCGHLIYTDEMTLKAEEEDNEAGNG